MPCPPYHRSGKPLDLDLAKCRREMVTRSVDAEGLAQRLGYSPNYVRDLISGSKVASASTVEKLAAALGVPVEDISLML